MSRTASAETVGICIVFCSISVAWAADSVAVGLATMAGLALVDFWVESSQRSER